MTKIKSLHVEDLARLFGTETNDLPDICRRMVREGKFRYRTTSIEERDGIILDILKKIDSPPPIPVGPKRKGRWKKGWEENLNDFISSGYDTKKLLPKYVRPFRPIRLDGKYVIPIEGDFELNYKTAFCSWIFSKYLKGVNSVYEFGCGTGLNLILLSKIFPDKRMYGLDWVPSSKKILDLLSEKLRLPIKGGIFNMFEPDQSLQIEKNSAIINISSLEQLGKNFKPFVDFVVSNTPAIVIDINHIKEFYNSEFLFDYLALKYEQQRGYLDGYLTYLKFLEKAGKIKILKAHYSSLGILDNDGFSYIVWKPLSEEGE